MTTNISIPNFFQSKLNANKNIAKPNLSHVNTVNGINALDENKAIDGIKNKEAKKVSIDDFDFSSLSNTLGQDLSNNKQNILLLTSSINKLSFNATGGLSDFSDLDIEETLSTIAASYVGLKNKIEKGNDADKEGLLKELDEKFNQAVEHFAKNLGISGSSFFKGLGSSNDVESKFKNSIIDVVQKKIDEYDNFLNSSLGSQFLEKVDLNKVSVQDFAKTMAKNNNLIEKFTAENKTEKDKAKDTEEVDESLFTFNDLKAMSAIEHQYRQMTTDGFIDKTEEQIGFELGMLANNVQDIMNKKGVSKQFENLLNTSFDDFSKNFIKNINQELENKADTADSQFNAGDRYSPLDKKKIDSIIQHTRSQYANNVDKTEAIINSFEYAKNSAQTTAQSNNAYRYNMGLEYFDRFYSQDLGNNYMSAQSEFQKYLRSFGLIQN